MISRRANIGNNKLSTMQHQMKCAYIREVCTHHKFVHCSSFEVAHATYHIIMYSNFRSLIFDLFEGALPYTKNYIILYTIHTHGINIADIEAHPLFSEF